MAAKACSFGTVMNGLQHKEKNMPAVFLVSDTHFGHKLPKKNYLEKFDVIINIGKNKKLFSI